MATGLSGVHKFSLQYVTYSSGVPENEIDPGLSWHLTVIPLAIMCWYTIDKYISERLLSTLLNSSNESINILAEPKPYNPVDAKLDTRIFSTKLRTLVVSSSAVVTNDQLFPDNFATSITPEHCFNRVDNRIYIHNKYL